jgi:replicative DNA helicase
MMLQGYSAESEASMLGALMVDNRLLSVVPFLRIEHFYASAHQRIFASICRRVERGEPANAFTMKLEFAEDPDLKALGGGSDLANATGSAAIHPPETANHIVNLWRRRELHGVLRGAIDHAFDEKKDPLEIAMGVVSACEKLASDNTDAGFVTSHEVSERVLKALSDYTPPYSTGLLALDSAMGGGLYPGKSYGFAAKKKTGKTTLLSTISANLEAAGVKHLFICGEMSADEIHQRTLARLLANTHRDSEPATARQTSFTAR